MANLRHASLYDNSSRPWIRCYAGPWVRHADPRSCCNQASDKGCLGSGISTSRLLGALPQRSRRRRGHAGGVQSRKDSAGGCLRHHEGMEQQPSSRAGPACLRGKSPTTATRLCRLLSHPHSFCLSARRRADPRDENGGVIYDSGVTLAETWHAMERLVDDGRCKSIGLSDINLERLQENRCDRADQTGRGAGRSPSVSPRVGTARLLPGSRASWSSHLPHWDMRWSRELRKIRSSRPLRGVSTRPRRKLYWPGPCNAVPRS